jgi:hypothetical protein
MKESALSQASRSRAPQSGAVALLNRRLRDAVGARLPVGVLGALMQQEIFSPPRGIHYGGGETSARAQTEAPHTLPSHAHEAALLRAILTAPPLKVMLWSAMVAGAAAVLPRQNRLRQYVAEKGQSVLIGHASKLSQSSPWWYLRCHFFRGVDVERRIGGPLDVYSDY